MKIYRFVSPFIAWRFLPLLLGLALLTSGCPNAPPGVATLFPLAFKDGFAISLNGLQAQRGTPDGKLPAMKLRGVTFDRAHNDWILLGDADPTRPGLPLDAVALALQSLRTHLEAPGIDIRPAAPTRDGKPAPMQKVSYFGGTANTVVGRWFFDFDYWMKRVSLGQEPVPLEGLPVYWHRSVAQMEQEMESCTLTNQAARQRSNRWWLCAGDLKATETGDTLTFDTANPLRVLAEGMNDDNAAQASSPCATRGTDDPLAAEYADWLTAHLPELRRAVPVSEIEQFAQLLAAFAWLAQQDPYRDLAPWVNASLPTVETPDSVPTISLQAERQHTGERDGQQFVHRHLIQLSGGVVVWPTLDKAPATDDSLARLHAKVLAARPVGQPAKWPFTFTEDDMKTAVLTTPRKPFLASSLPAGL